MDQFKNYIDFLKYYGSRRIPYPELLKTKEWNIFRAKIIIRDNCTCQSCNESKSLKKYSSRLLQKEVLEDGTVKYTQNIPKDPLEIASDYSIHVHHLYYIEGLLPWEYKDEELISYCHECHEKWHKENKVKYYAYNINGELIEKSYQTCDRCNGSGYLEEYKHVDNGVCFKCWGRTFLEINRK